MAHPYDLTATAAAHLRRPGLVVLTGPPGCGRSTLLTAMAAAAGGPVHAGEPTRRIAGQLGISAETVDTHIRAGMRKLGARTRTEAAALAFARNAGGDRR